MVGTMGAILLSRVYDHDADEDGPVFLVERLWPRGIRRADVVMTEWLKDVAPTTELRKWFSHSPERWQEFRRRYKAELDARPQAWQPLLDAARSTNITLLYTSRDREHNNAVVLRDYLTHKLTTGRSRPTRSASN
jgi:uncharacterized protein YeaO (DUF488 family)